jgi:hypothetical protein
MAKGAGERNYRTEAAAPGVFPIKGDYRKEEWRQQVRKPQSKFAIELVFYQNPLDKFRDLFSFPNHVEYLSDNSLREVEFDERGKRTLN